MAAKAVTLYLNMILRFGWAELGPLRQLWSSDGSRAGGWRVSSVLFTPALGPWCYMLGRPLAPRRLPLFRDLPHTCFHGSRVFRGEKLQGPWWPRLQNTQSHFCVAQNKSQGQLDSRGREIDPTAWWKGLQNTTAMFFQNCLPGIVCPSEYSSWEAKIIQYCWSFKLRIKNY